MTTHDTGLRTRKQHMIDMVVEQLGQLSDRRRAANEANDLDALEKIAAEYEARKMVRTAQEIRAAIAIRKAGKK